MGLKKKTLNRIGFALWFSAMSTTLVIPVGAYLSDNSPEKPEMASKYNSLEYELYSLNRLKTFTLEEALDSAYISRFAQKRDSLFEKIKEIEDSQQYENIRTYEEKRKQYNKHFLYLGLFSVLYLPLSVYGAKKSFRAARKIEEENPKH